MAFLTKLAAQMRFRGRAQLLTQRSLELLTSWATDMFSAAAKDQAATPRE
jgi:hypothetical protein